jgi:hypothetical protein
MHPFGGEMGFFKEILGIAPLPTIRECQCSLPFFRGELQHSVSLSEGALGCLRESLTVEENQGKIPLLLWILLDSNLRSRMDLREDPQLMEKYPQTIPRIFKVVRPLQGYIRRPLHGERERH